jgi:hypothetical protein
LEWASYCGPIFNTKKKPAFLALADVLLSLKRNMFCMKHGNAGFPG